MQTAQSHPFASTGVGILREAFQTRAARPRSWEFGLYRGDRSLTGSEEPSLGAHLVTPRFTYAHHRVYVGHDTVVHYAAFAKHWSAGPVEETSLTRFADGHPVWVRPAHPNGRQGAEIVRRARSRLGENHYRFFSNNCEHFTEWCVNGEHRSPQVEHLLARVVSVSAVLRDCMQLPKTAPRRGGVCHLDIDNSLNS